MHAYCVDYMGSVHTKHVVFVMYEYLLLSCEINAVFHGFGNCGRVFRVRSVTYLLRIPSVPRRISAP